MDTRSMATIADGDMTEIHSAQGFFAPAPELAG
jgi:hypothetical protein